MRTTLVVSAAVCVLSGCMYSPANGTKQESGQPTTVGGWTLGKNQVVSIRARNWDTDAIDGITTVTSGSLETISGSGYYPWSVTIPASALASLRWRPNFVGPTPGPGVTPFTAMGRLELSAFQGSEQMRTFSHRAQQCAEAEVNAGETWSNAGENCSDGRTLALVDNTAVGQVPITTGFTHRAHKTNVTEPTLAGTSPVDVRVERYVSPGGVQVFAMICAPPGSGAHRRLMIKNHGGGVGTNKLDAAECLDSARRGWVYAISAYRGEPLYVPNEVNSFPGGTTWASWNLLDIDTGFALPTKLTSTGRVEVNLGEVMDVHRLLDLMRVEPNVDSSKVFMWGHSHGAGITLRALETGAQVKAAAAVAPPSDWADLVRKCNDRLPLPPDDVCSGVLFGATVDGVVLPSTPSIVGGFPPAPAPGVNAILRSYDWRSAGFFASDLALRDDVTLLVQHGLDDNIVRAGQSCQLVSATFEEQLANSWYVPPTAAPGVSIGTSSVPECPGFVFSGTPRPIDDWALEGHYFMAYRGVNHSGFGPSGEQLWDDFLRFRNWLETHL